MEREENQRGVKKPQPVDPFVDALFERYARVDPERRWRSSVG
jgi:hypothetical protein